MANIQRASRMALILALIAGLVVIVPAGQALDATHITVNTTTDALGDGLCSFQEAVLAADTDTAQDSGACDAGAGTDEIVFDISGSGVQVISIPTPLLVGQPVIIDGTTQPGYAGAPLVHLSTDEYAILGFDTTADGSTIKGLQFSNTYTDMGSGGFDVVTAADGLSVKACYFNTDGTSSLAPLGTGVGIVSSNNLVGTGLEADRNLFGGYRGVDVGSGSLNFIIGNYFGVQADGITALTDAGTPAEGIRVRPSDATGSHNLIRGNVIGFFSSGIKLEAPTHHNTIVQNYIGVGADGVTAISNSTGVDIRGSSDNTIGGTNAADRNVISANEYLGNILITGPGDPAPGGNVIQGNYIGTTADGSAAVSPPGMGVRLELASSTLIGGTEPGSGNLISGNGPGIYVNVTAAGTIIRGNRIGTNAAGTAAVPNVNGIHALAAINVGDSVTPGDNLISGNGSLSYYTGIFLDGASGTTIYGNRIGLNADGTAGLPNTTGILVEDGTATVSKNWVGYNGIDGLRVGPTGSLLSGSTDNCFTLNAGLGANSLNEDVLQPLTDNWWGDASGPYHPTGNPGGVGDEVSDYILFSPYLTAAPDTCRIETVEVHIGPDLAGSHVIPGAHGTQQTYPGFNSGPVKAANTDGGSVVSSIRILYGSNSYSEMMGFPNDATTHFWFPWYNNVAMDSQLRVGNLDTVSTTITVELGPDQIDSFSLAAGATKRRNYAGSNGGPLHVTSSGGSPILSTVRILWGESLSEMMGYPDNTTDEFWFPWYNNIAMDSQLRVSNIGTESTTITVAVAGAEIDSFALAAGSAKRKNYPGVNGGPMHITSSAGPILATIRILYGATSLSEMMGFPRATAAGFWFPWYDNVGTDAQLRVSNIGTSSTKITVSLSGEVIDAFTLAAGGAVRRNYANKNGGALHVASTTGSILATVRILYHGTSLYELMGYPDDALTSTQWFPWYNNVAMDSQMRIAVP